MTRWRRLLVSGLLLTSMVIQPLQVMAQTDEDPPTSTNNGPYSSEKTGDTISIEVPDCPGVTRDIDAHKVPPSIYPKPCGAQGTGATTNNLGQPTGEYGSGLGAPPDGTLFWTSTCGQTYNITQGMGTHAIDYSNYDYTLGVTGHPGVDIGMPTGTPLCSPVAGTVSVSGGSGYFYNTEASRYETGKGELRIVMSNGDELIMGHMSSITVSVGQTITVGQSVGLSGMPGNDHLHLEYRKAGEATPSGFRAVDPREVFGVPAGSAPTGGSGTPSTPSAPSGGGGSANSMSYFQDKYGFIAPSGDQYAATIAANQANFTILRDWAVKAGPLVGIEPEMIVWWTVVETREPWDSYSYSNCGDYTYETDINCPAVYSGGWQVGYGQQYVVGGGGGLAKAFTEMRGSPSDASLVQRLGQEVLDKAGIGKTFPNQNISQLEANGSYSYSTEGNYWLYTILKDPAVSAYLLGQELASDTAAAGGGSFMDHMCGWGSYYCQQDTIQKFANGMNDVLKAWGIAGSASTATCTTGNALSGANGCSTQADSLNGNSVEEFVQKINENMDVYKSSADCGDVPWEMMAAIHLRETGLLREFTGNNGGPWQVDPPQDGLDEFDFSASGCWSAEHLQGKAGDAPLSGRLRPQMDPSNSSDAELIKHAFFGFNGRGGFESNAESGKCTPKSEGDAYNWDCSAYVMNNWDAQHSDMCIRGRIDGGPLQDHCQGIDGAWKVYYKLVYSTYDGDGKLLVYGGKCQEGNGTTTTTNPDGSTTTTSLPTDTGKSINSQFFGGIGGGAGTHIGIDIGNGINDPIYAISDGEIVESGWTYPPAGQINSPTGYYLKLKTKGPSGDRWVYYGHLSPEELAGTGSKVVAGQKIGKTGALMVMDPQGNYVRNGITGGPHLHFDIRTQSREDGNINGHVQPCSVPGFDQGYPELTCPGAGGQPW